MKNKAEILTFQITIQDKFTAIILNNFKINSNKVNGQIMIGNTNKVTTINSWRWTNRIYDKIMKRDIEIRDKNIKMKEKEKIKMKNQMMEEVNFLHRVWNLGKKEWKYRMSQVSRLINLSFLIILDDDQI